MKNVLLTETRGCSPTWILRALWGEHFARARCCCRFVRALVHIRSHEELLTFCI